MKKALSVAERVLSIILVIAALAVMIFTIVSVLTFNRTDRNLFGYKAMIVLSDSMSATDFSAGDLVLVKYVDPATLQPGDIIAYESTNTESFGEVVTHKIRSLTTDANGKPGFITYGTTTNTDDEQIVTYEYVIGKYEKHIPKVGTFFNFLKTTPGYIICILVPFSVLIFFRVLDTVKAFRVYKAEQMAELQKEKDSLKAQAEENQRMMAELLALKAQMAAGTAAPPSAGIADDPAAPVGTGSASPKDNE